MPTPSHVPSVKRPRSASAEKSKITEVASNIAVTGTTAGMSQLVLDSSPLAIMIYDQDYACIDCNGAAIKLFEIEDKNDFLENHFLYSAPIQPNGMFAGDHARELVQVAMENGENTAEWMHRN